MPDMPRLPEMLQPLFWDVNFSTLDWKADRDFIVRRILREGSFDTLRWLRSTLGDDDLRAWMLAHDGGRLSPRQLRYWELVLGLPEKKVAKWVAQAKSSPWENRVQL